MRRVIDAWEDTEAFDVADLLFGVDSDDPMLGKYRAVESDHTVTLHIGARIGMAHLTNVLAWANRRRYFAMGSAGDDHVPRTNRWAHRYIEVLEEMGTGIVYGDDGLQGRSLCTEWMMTSNIVSAIGSMIPAPVQHLYADNAVMVLGRDAGVLRHLPDVHIEHMHPVARKAKLDEGYNRVNSPERWREDGATFNSWATSTKDSDVQKVRALL